MLSGIAVVKNNLAVPQKGKHRIKMSLSLHCHFSNTTYTFLKSKILGPNNLTLYGKESVK